MPHPVTHRLIAVATCAALALASCSNDDDPSKESTTTVTSTTTAEGPDNTADDTGANGAPTTAPQLDPASEAAMERARSLNLVVDDFPSGWQAIPPAEGEVGVVELCTSVDLDAHLLAMARSDSFSFTIEPGVLQASSAVTILNDEAAAVDLLADFRDDVFLQCATDTLRRGTDLYTVTGSLSRNETEPDLGDEAVALSGDFTVTPTDGSELHSLSAVVVATRKGDTVVTFSSTAQDRLFDEEATRGALTVIDNRLER